MRLFRSRCNRCTPGPRLPWRRIGSWRFCARCSEVFCGIGIAECELPELLPPTLGLRRVLLLTLFPEGPVLFGGDMEWSRNGAAGFPYRNEGAAFSVTPPDSGDIQCIQKKLNHGQSVQKNSRNISPPGGGRGN